VAAAHVQRVVAQGSVQPKPAGPAGRSLAPHVQAAERRAAPHDRATQAALQVKPGLARSGPAPLAQAADLRASRQISALQPKLANPPQTTRTHATPIHPSRVVQSKSEFSNYIVRQIVETAAVESKLLERVPLSASWIMQLEDKFFSNTIILPKDDTSEAREALSWLTSQIVKQDYPECAYALPFLRRILKELLKLEQENRFDQAALGRFALHTTSNYRVAVRIVNRRKLEDQEEESESSDEEGKEEKVEEGKEEKVEKKESFENNLKLGIATATATGSRVYRRRGSFNYSTKKGKFHITGTQTQIDLHKKIEALQLSSFRGNRVKVRLTLFWVKDNKLNSTTLSGTVSEESTFKSAEFLSKKEQEDLIPKVRSLLKVVGNPYHRNDMGLLLHSERDLVVKMDQIQNFVGKVKQEIAHVPKGSRLLILALDVHSCKNKVCSRCDSVLRSLSQGGWKRDVATGLDDYDTSEFRIIVRAGSDEGSGDAIVKLTKVKSNTLETFTPQNLPCILDIQPLEHLKHFPELKEFSNKL
jgi:hypothetical protein